MSDDPNNAQLAFLRLNDYALVHIDYEKNVYTYSSYRNTIFWLKTDNIFVPRHLELGKQTAQALNKLTKKETQ